MSVYVKMKMKVSRETVDAAIEQAVTEAFENCDRVTVDESEYELLNITKSDVNYDPNAEEFVVKVQLEWGKVEEKFASKEDIAKMLAGDVGCYLGIKLEGEVEYDGE